MQVLSTTKFASPNSTAAASPVAANPASIAAPSAWEARQPKFLTQNRSKTQFYRVMIIMGRFRKSL